MSKFDLVDKRTNEILRLSKKLKWYKIWDSLGLNDQYGQEKDSGSLKLDFTNKKVIKNFVIKDLKPEVEPEPINVRKSPKKTRSKKEDEQLKLL